ncbi:general secretion pathway protein I [Trabulsiella guamensis ATCC 49490]|uniref:Type II secretion system protein I n=1 Tax=Trabulsiella guamensis ATCC 49490 TaxID=1005994 RepID=A0A085A4M0_9ENTR|nr:type II secretion system minor pseudopilin GspI [Trabulsiella guamensis]KFC05165.1 general secretion pathway protein I [Trabulsiella guamensis ATCC 49490]
MKQTEGFTLLEVLLALAIFAVVSLTLANSLGITVNGTARVQQQQLALWVADNQLIDQQLSQATGDQATSNSEGDISMGGYRWHWQLTSHNADQLTSQQLRVSLDGDRASELWRTLLSSVNAPNAEK